ncbi:MAG: gamma-glutamyltransferase [Pseudonocardiales bacterium]|nr:gamma-glutamyltransferase [Pseudonocardiales bacterium]
MAYGASFILQLPGSAHSATLEFGQAIVRTLRAIAVLVIAGIVAALTTASSAVALPSGEAVPSGGAVAIGVGGAVATSDAEASRAGLEVLREGGNAVDAAVSAAATLGVTEPYSSGIGGGGFLVYFQASTGRVLTLDGRETAPQAMRAAAFLDPASGQPVPFSEAVTSGLAVGVPATPALWALALHRWGRLSLAQALAPAIRVADRGFPVNATFAQETADNAARFAHFSSTSALFLPGGRPPVVGATLRNPDLAQTYRQIARHGVDWFYRGPLAAEIVQTVRHPPLVAGDHYNARSGLMTSSDVNAYRVIPRDPTHMQYQDLDVYSMGPPSSGGTTVGEALNMLNILSQLSPSAADPVAALQDYLEASRLAFADRDRYVGDPDQVPVPLAQLLSPDFAKTRACLIEAQHAASSPVPPGDPDGDYHGCPAPSGPATRQPGEGPNTTSLVTSDQWGNVVAYTLTIEQTGGSGIVVPGRGFLLNNELTDFTFAPTQGAAPDPNLPAPGKRPRSSMAPTIILRHKKPLLAVGSPGGATIITTVLQILVNRLNLGMNVAEAIAAPRASQRNTVTTEAEPAFLNRYALALQARGQRFTTTPEIGAATGLEFLNPAKVLAAAEPVRRGGGTALVMRPTH